MKRKYLWIAGQMRDVTNRESRRKSRLEEKQVVTSRISETCRYIGFGLLALFYTMKTSDGRFAQELVANHSFALYVLGASGAAAVLFDYLQYMAGSVAVERALNREDTAHLYSTEWRSYQAREACFWAKQAAALIGVVCLAYLILRGV